MLFRRIKFISLFNSNFISDFNNFLTKLVKKNYIFQKLHLQKKTTLKKGNKRWMDKSSNNLLFFNYYGSDIQNENYAPGRFLMSLNSPG
jgi:hypothetical protein